jgi:hypothetical protein
MSEFISTTTLGAWSLPSLILLPIVSGFLVVRFKVSWQEDVLPTKNEIKTFLIPQKVAFWHKENIPIEIGQFACGNHIRGYVQMSQTRPLHLAWGFRNGSMTGSPVET